MSISDRMKQIREILRLTQVEFAEKLDTNQRSVSRWETGELRPRGRTLERIAELAEIRVHWLETGEGEKKYFPDLNMEERELISTYRAISPTFDRLIIRARIHLAEKEFREFNNLHHSLERLKGAFSLDSRDIKIQFATLEENLRDLLQKQMLLRQKDQADIWFAERQAAGDEEWEQESDAEKDFIPVFIKNALDFHQKRITQIVNLAPDIVEELDNRNIEKDFQAKILKLVREGRKS